MGKTMSWVVGIPPIKMVMTGGWFMALLYPPYSGMRKLLMFKHSVTTKSRAIAHSNRDTPGASCVPFA